MQTFALIMDIFGIDVQAFRFIPYAILGGSLATLFDQRSTEPRGMAAKMLGGFIGGLIVIEYTMYKGLHPGLIRGLTVVAGIAGELLLWQFWTWAASGKFFRWLLRKFRNGNNSSQGHGSAGFQRQRHGSGEVKPP